jgi:endonuclease/exonuclease/phosphatase family metal-dependent hydrolase
MKIVSWNCHYGFSGEKADKIMQTYSDADIFVIPECKKRDGENLSYPQKRVDWYSDSKESGNPDYDLGIGIFCKDSISIRRSEKWSDDPDFRYVLPYHVHNGKDEFTLFAVWTKNKTNADDPLEYVQKAHAAINYYQKSNLFAGKVILIGDFNSNEIWDTQYKCDENHSALVKKLSDLSIHNCAGIVGKDKIPTYFYQYRGQPKEVTDDYCFVSDGFKIKDFEVGKREDWIAPKLSDHCPLIVTF